MSELLAPAGNIESLDAAIGEGADAVYLGLKSFNARMRTANFTWNQFEAAVSAVHRQGKKIYVTVNTVCEENETERLYRFLSYLNKVKPDGLIVQDFAIIRMCQEFFPDMELHASTQMNVESAAAANILAKDGINRVVLARELGLDEIRAIKAEAKTELEMFVHGAICVSESGLCLFSSYLGGKSANRGMCTQACRRFYKAEYPEGSKQGYYFSPCDLQLIDHIPDLMEVGIDSFKIEGRMKSAEYVGSVVAAYRYVMDHWKEDKKGAIAAGKRMLASDFARSKTDYWYGFKDLNEGVEKAGEKILNPDQAGGTGIYLGKVSAVKRAPAALNAALRESSSGGESVDEKKVQLAIISGGSYDPDPGDSIRLHRKDDTGRVSHKVRSVEIDGKGKRWLDIPASCSVGDDAYLLQIKSMSKRYQRVLPNDLTPFRKQPLDEKLPFLDLTPIKKGELNFLPEGVYVQVSSLADAFQAQAFHPVRLIAEYNSDTKTELLSGKTVLPLSKKSVIISLDPFCAPEQEKTLQSELAHLVTDGFFTFTVNNIAHIEILRRIQNESGKQINMIAGSYLYTFNRWAVSWLENQNIEAFIMPYENSKKNLEATFDMQVRQRVIVPVFAYPALFRIRFKLPENYGFTYMSDKENEEFKIVSSADGSFVMPEMPFSLLDKTDRLSQAGFKRLLIDFSRIKISKNQVKSVTASMIKKQPLADISRFNWKDGFYSARQIEEFKAGNERAKAERLSQKQSTAAQSNGRNKKPHRSGKRK